MPKGKPFPEGDEEEKTTIESQWEDEASTTVEQGDVADKIRALVEPRRGNNNTNVTGTGTVDEHTIDDQRAQSAITPVRDIARLQITQGNDAGQEIEIRPGKTYTIGRAIDNDVVLTDIAVSRKHFDLRFEDGAWVIVDRGSGNGTVVNGNLEDNPFMLANGDLIEIGNTVFRFDQPNAAARPERTVDLDRDEEELSTVAGKPLRTEIPDQPPLAARPQRPKTLPPPTPLRARGSTQPPPVYPPLAAQALPQPALPSPLPMPMPQMAQRSVNLPGVTPSGPTMLGDQMGSQNGMPAAMPAQSLSQQRPIYTYPQATEIPPHSVHAQMLLIQTQNRRGDGSTAHVPPTPYDHLQAPVPRYSPPQLTKRTKLVLGGIGLAVFAAVLTVAITKSGSEPTKSTVAANQDDKVKLESTKSTAKVAAMTSVEPTEPTVPSAPAKAAKAEPETITTTVPTVEPEKAPTVEPAKTIAKNEPAKNEPAKSEPAKNEPAKNEPAKTIAKTEPVKTAPTPKVVKNEPAKTPKRERREVRRDTTPPPAPAPAPKRVATAGDPDAARNQADSLYRAKKFSEASSYLANAAKKFDEEDAREMRRTSDMYAKLGRAMSQGTAPATKSTEAFEALRQAQNYDRNVGSAFDNEIQTKLAQVAPKAALSYFASKNYQQARGAVIAAQQFGSSESVKLVSQKLESVAGELYNEGMRELSSNPSAAREKFKQITTIVDSKSNWFQKAQKQLKGG